MSLRIPAALFGTNTDSLSVCSLFRIRRERFKGQLQSRSWSRTSSHGPGPRPMTTATATVETHNVTDGRVSSPQFINQTWVTARPLGSTTTGGRQQRRGPGQLAFSRFLANDRCPLSMSPLSVHPSSSHFHESRSRSNSTSVCLHLSPSQPPSSLFACSPCSSGLSVSHQFSAHHHFARWLYRGRATHKWRLKGAGQPGICWVFFFLSRFSSYLRHPSIQS